MRFFITEIQAKDPFTGAMKVFSGPTVEAISWSDAEDFCQTHGLGYCKVTGELVGKVKCKPGTSDPDWSTRVDYRKQFLN